MNALDERRPLFDLACHGLLWLVLALLCLPVWLAFVAASLPVDEAARAPLPWLPGDRFLENVATAWQRADLGRALANSVFMASAVTAGKIAVSILSAFALVYFRLRARWLVFWAIFLSLMLPVEVRIAPTYEVVANLLTPAYALLDLLGAGPAQAGTGADRPAKVSLIDTYAGLTLPLLASATATFLFRQIFLSIPEELAEAALVEGCGPVRFLRSILLPLSRANLAALAVVLFVWSWNQYLWPLLVTTEERYATIVMTMQRLVEATDAAPEFHHVAAVAMLAMLPPVAVVILMQRWFVKGLVETDK